MVKMSFETLIYSQGYYFVFLGSIFQSVTLVILAGYLANDYLNLVLVIIISALGSFLGNQVFFYIGRHGGKKIISKSKYLSKKSSLINKKIKRYEGAAIMIFKFVQGIKIISGIFFGTTRISHRKYTLLNLASSILWALVFVFIGYFFGIAAKELFGKVEDFQISLFVVLVVIGVVIGVSKHLLKKN